MRDRHEHQVEDLRATLEASLDAPDARPSRWTPQLVDMRRQQKRLVRERKFGEALDLLKAAETRETEEIVASPNDATRTRQGARVALRAAGGGTRRVPAGVPARGGTSGG